MLSYLSQNGTLWIKVSEQLFPFNEDVYVCHTTCLFQIMGLWEVVNGGHAPNFGFKVIPQNIIVC
jgi:hypothetical protein